MSYGQEIIWDEVAMRFEFLRRKFLWRPETESPAILSEMERFSRDAIERLQKQLGPHHPHVLRGLKQLRFHLNLQNKGADVQAVDQRIDRFIRGAEESMQRALKEEKVEGGLWIHFLADDLWESVGPLMPEVRSRLQKALDIYERLGDEAQLEAASVTRKLARSQSFDSQKNQEAVALYEHAIAIYAKKLPKSHFVRAAMAEEAVSHAISVAGQENKKSSDRTAAMALETLAMLEAQKLPDYSIGYFLESLAELFKVRGEPDKAVPFRKRAEMAQI
jgi:hypothetical protein